MYKTRVSKEQDIYGILGLLEETFPSWPNKELDIASRDFWKWKYQESPKGSDIIVTESEDKIIGCHHGPRFNLLINGSLLLASYGTDMAVSVDHRNKGISRQQVEKLREERIQNDVGYALVLASNPFNIESLAKRQPRFPYELRNLVKISDVDMFLNYFDVKNPNLVKYGVAIFKKINTLIYPKSKLPEYKTEIISFFGEEIGAFWDKYSANYDFIIERKRNYLNWRYCDNRAGKYFVFQVTKGNEVQGYSVTSVSRKVSEHPVGFIVDLHALDEACARVLVHSMNDWFEKQSINLVNYLNIKGHPYEKILFEYGFVDSRVKFNLFYKIISGEDKIASLGDSSPSRVYFSWGDHDTLPVKISV